jgi:CubicO group peptidase (beta-lactamase class C family)
LVVNIVGSTDPNFNENSVVGIYSSGKTLAAIILAFMRDQGLIDYQEKVSKYWPEFAKNGKDHLTVANIMKHEGGLSWLKTPITSDDLKTENIKKNWAGKKIEEEEFHNPLGIKRLYHGDTKDIISNEIFRRVEPQHRTMDEYLREVVSPKMGGVDWFIRLPESEYKRSFTYSYWSNLRMIINMCHSKKNGNVSGSTFSEFMSAGSEFAAHEEAL